MKIRTRLSILLSAGAMVFATGAFTSSAAYATNNGVEIANYGTGKCLTVQNGSLAFGAPVIQSICDNLSGQQWIFLGTHGGIQQVYNLRSGLCMEATSFANSAPVVQDSCGSGEAGIFWAITDLTAPFPQRKIILKNYTASTCLDLENGDISDGVPLQVWQCNSRTNNQLWRVDAAPTN